jgi:hypothetical protein
VTQLFTIFSGRCRTSAFFACGSFKGSNATAPAI